MGQIFL